MRHEAQAVLDFAKELLHPSGGRTAAQFTTVEVPVPNGLLVVAAYLAALQDLSETADGDRAESVDPDSLELTSDRTMSYLRDALWEKLEDELQQLVERWDENGNR